jgi:hypothetical protein
MTTVVISMAVDAHTRLLTCLRHLLKFESCNLAIHILNKGLICRLLPGRSTPILSLAELFMLISPLIYGFLPLLASGPLASQIFHEVLLHPLNVRINFESHVGNSFAGGSLHCRQIVIVEAGNKIKLDAYIRNPRRSHSDFSWLLSISLKFLISHIFYVLGCLELGFGRCGTLSLQNWSQGVYLGGWVATLIIEIFGPPVRERQMNVANYQTINFGINILLLVQNSEWLCSCIVIPSTDCTVSRASKSLSTLQKFSLINVFAIKIVR